MPRKLLATLVAALLLVYVVSSLRHLDVSDRRFVLDFPGLPLAPRAIAGGWHFIPRLVAQVSEYPAAPVKLRVDLSGKQAAKSLEGAKVEVEAEMTYAIPPERLLDLHRARGPGYEAAWLADLLRRETASRIAAVSYDVVRNRDPELVQSVRGAVRGKVAAEGIRIESLRIFPVAGVGEASGGIRRVGAEPLRRKLLVIGVDSFDWRIIDPLLRQGRMPHVARLIARGARAHLRTVRPILSPVVWTSIATGVKPARHGIVDFVVSSRATGALMPVTSAMREVPALWTLMSRQGIDVSVVAWWATWPAETVRGSIVTDRIAYQLFEDSVKEDWKSTDPQRSRGKTYPPDLFERLRPMIRVPAEVADEEVAWFLPGRKLPTSLTGEQRNLLNRFRTVIAAGETYHAIARERFRAPDSSLMMVYYEGPDTASHLFMRYRPPLLPGVAPSDSRLLGGIVDRYYERQDRFIGEMVEAAGEEATVLLVSDHGFKSDNNRPPYSDPRIEKGNAADWHTPVGVFIAAGADIRPGIDLDAASVLDIVPTILVLYGLPVARDMDGQPLTDAIEGGFLKEHPVAWIDSYGGIRPPTPEAGAVAAAASPEAAAQIEKLRSLGYIGEERLTAHNNRGVMALDEGDVDGAIADFEQALATGGGDAGTMIRTNLARAYLQRGDLEKARSFAARALAEDPQNKQAELILSGVAIREKNPRAAEEHLRRAIAIDPTFVQARTKLGEVLEKQGQDEEALSEFRKVVEVAPLSPMEYNNIGNIYRKRGDLDRAMAAYHEALKCDAQYIGAYNNLGLCLQEKGRLGEARALYEKALVIRPENPILRNSLGTLLAQAGDRERAIVEFRRAVMADPEWPIAQGNLATLLFETGRFPEAQSAFERWVKLEPPSVEARLGLALSELSVNRWDEAIAQFREVLRRDPANLRAHVALGETLMRKGDLGGAQRHLEEAAKLEQKVPRVYNSLGEVYLRRGLRREAATAFQRSLALEPKQEKVRRRLAETGR